MLTVTAILVGLATVVFIVLTVISNFVSGPLKVTVDRKLLERCLIESRLEITSLELLSTDQAFFSRYWTPLSSWKYYDIWGGRSRIPRWDPLHDRLTNKFRALKDQQQ